MHRVQVLDARGVARALERMAAELVERVGDEKLLYLVGVQTRGVPIARRLATLVAAATGHEPPVGALDIALYRDDVGPWRPAHQQPILRDTELPVTVDGKVVCLVDDVLYTGRTVRAALDTLMDYGRPHAIRLAVLVDRGHRELPIAADFVGRTVPTSHTEDVQVRLRESDGEEGVWIGKEVAE
jgi:pyrimidine operon attenuation protein/uracil phosphoribosyltransferase